MLSFTIIRCLFVVVGRNCCITNPDILARRINPIDRERLNQNAALVWHSVCVLQSALINGYTICACQGDAVAAAVGNSAILNAYTLTRLRVRIGCQRNAVYQTVFDLDIFNGQPGYANRKNTHTGSSRQLSSLQLRR